MKILDFIKRGMKGYSDSDVYDFDIWFINTIPKMLQELVENTPVTPCSDEWKQEINEIINCFKEVQKIDNIQFTFSNCDDLMSKRNEYLDKGFELLRTNFNDLWIV